MLSSARGLATGALTLLVVTAVVSTGYVAGGLIVDATVAVPTISHEMKQAGPNLHEIQHSKLEAMKEIICEHSFNMSDCTVETMRDRYASRTITDYETMRDQLMLSSRISHVMKFAIIFEGTPATPNDMTGQILNAAQTSAGQSISYGWFSAMGEQATQSCKRRNIEPRQCFEEVQTLIVDTINRFDPPQVDCKAFNIDDFEREKATAAASAPPLIQSQVRLSRVMSYENVTLGCEKAGRFPGSIGMIVDLSLHMNGGAIITKHKTTAIMNVFETIQEQYEDRYNES